MTIETDPPVISEPRLLNVHEAIVEVMKDIGAVEKTRTNVSQKYNFRGIDEFLTAAHPVMAQHGLTIVPAKMRHKLHVRDRVSNDGRPGFTMHVILRVTWRATGPDGTTEMFESVGEAADTADKATNKAMSAAEKYMLISVFKIPTQDLAEGDADHPDMGGRRGPSDASPPPSSRPGPRASEVKAPAKPTKTQLDNIGILANEVIGTDTAQIKAVMMAITERVAVRSHMTFDEAVKVIGTLGKVKSGEKVIVHAPSGVKIYDKGEEPFETPGLVGDPAPDGLPANPEFDVDLGDGSH